MSTRPLLVVAPPARTSRGLGWWFNLGGIAVIHAGAVLAVVRGVSLGLVLLALATYLVRMFAITAGYHRYFAHRAYKTSRWLQLAIAVLGTMSAQKGPLWWAATHRLHHRYSDTERDVHSPLRRGFWWSHMFWWLGSEYERTPIEVIEDYAGYPELRWLDKHHWLGPLALGTAIFAIGGLDAFLWGMMLSTCVLAHATFTINSLAHVFGSRRYATTDTSRNNFWLALLTLGEGWHNNHHHYMNSANQGFFWWEVDLSYWALCVCEKLGLVRDVRRPPARILTKNLLAEVGERAPLLIAGAAERPVTPVPAEAARPEPTVV